MLHAVTSKTKQRSSGGNSARATADWADRPPLARRNPFAVLQSAYGNQAVLRFLQSSGVNSAGGAASVLQRKCACGGGGADCAECRKKKTDLQRKPASSKSASSKPTPGVPPIVHDVLRSPGRPLDAGARAFFEPRLGHDFGSVRIHTDSQAAESARAVNALAYTVGRNVVFGHGNYRPASSEGQRLLAHELTHVVQQGSENVPPAVQRDLATPPPAVPAPAQANLTPAQITAAINFNRARYDEADTRLIQSYMGGPVTGSWTEDNITTIASIQEEYGLHKDGMVGNETFRFLDREQGLEKSSTKTKDCLVSFTVIGPDTATFGRNDPTHCRFGSHFRIEAQFSPRCGCDQFQYRQFVSGHLHRTRAGVVTDIPLSMPGGVLLDAVNEDADTNDPVRNYGHREQAVDAIVENHYVDAHGNDDQAKGCRFRSQDFPGGPFGDCLPGDRYDLLMRFRGEIQRNGSPIQSKFWTAINRVNWMP
jgi:hypothetical protein